MKSRSSLDPHGWRLCELAGEVEFGDVLLCRRHTSQLEAQDWVRLLVGIVSSLELSLRSIPLLKDRDLTLLLRAQRAQAKRELALAREDLKQLDDEEDIWEVFRI
jgi:hypothetical protein